MKIHDDIITFDLRKGQGSMIDVAKMYPLSEIHAVRSTKPILDTIIPAKNLRINLSIPLLCSVSPLTRSAMLDIASPRLARERGLVEAPIGEKRGSTIDLFPPIFPPYGALDVRGDPLPKDRTYPDIYRRTLPIGLHARRLAKQTSRYLQKKKKPMLYSALFFLGLMLPTVWYTKILIEQAYAQILSIHTGQSQGEIAQTIRKARGDFERANILFTPFRIVPWDTAKLARIALDGGLALTRGMDRIMAEIPTTGSGEIIERNKNFTDSLYRPTPTDIRPLVGIGIDDPTLWMKKNKAALEYFASELKTAGKSYAKASDIDHPRASEIAHIGRGIEKVSGLLDIYFQNEPQILALLGADVPERYIVFNQNRDEIRANGGFPGSIITFTMFRGNIEDFRTDDVYYYDWNLYPFKETPPPWLALLSNNYGLRDVNYYPDFRDTLEKANAFIERSGDPTVTIGIALNQWLFQDILADIGPITLSWVTESFRTDNFSTLMSVLVESRYGEETSAKDILRKFVDQFAKKVHEKRAYEEVIAHIEKALRDGEILVASRNTSIDAYLSTFRKRLPWEEETASREEVMPTPVITGSLSQTGTPVSGETLVPVIKPKNWVYPLLTSLSGNKSDRIITRNYTAESTLIGACTYENKLTFSHKHLYSRMYEEEIKRYMALIGIGKPVDIEKMLGIQGKGKNITYMRILVPPKAALTGSTAGITINTTPVAKEYVFTLETPIGGTATKTFRYRTSIAWCEGKSLPVEWYRQPGLARTKMESK